MVSGSGALVGYLWRLSPVPGAVRGKAEKERLVGYPRRLAAAEGFQGECSFAPSVTFGVGGGVLLLVGHCAHCAAISSILILYIGVWIFSTSRGEWGFPCVRHASTAELNI